MSRSAPITSQDLKSMPLFASLLPVQRQLLGTLMQRVNFASGKALMNYGDPCRYVYFLQSGTVRICIARPTQDLSQPSSQRFQTEKPRQAEPPLAPSPGQNKQTFEDDENSAEENSAEENSVDEESGHMVLNLCGAGEMLGEISCLDGLGHSAGVVAIEACRTLRVEASAFRECVETMPTLMRAILHLTQTRYRYATRQLFAFTTLDVTGRLASQLLLFSEKYGHEQPNGHLDIAIRIQQSDLADMVGASRARVNICVGELRAAGCLASPRVGRLTITDRALLSRYAGRRAAETVVETVPETPAQTA